MSEWHEFSVLENHHWNERLHSLKVDGCINFKAGQYARLALDIDGQRIARPYSFVNPPGSDYMEFLFNQVPAGPLSNALAHLRPGDKVWLATPTAGFLVLDEIPAAADLWLLATGSAIGPYLSILQTEEVWGRFQRVYLAYAVRYARDLCYQPLLKRLVTEHPGQFAWTPFVSREAMEGAFPGRIPDAIASGKLENLFGSLIGPEQSQVMICGNPEMVSDCTELLLQRGLQKNLRRKPGHISVERYW